MSSRKKIPKGKKPASPAKGIPPKDASHLVLMCEKDSSPVVASTSETPSTSGQIVISTVEEEPSRTDEAHLQQDKVASVAKKVISTDEKVEENIEVSGPIHNVPSGTDGACDTVEQSASDGSKGPATIDEIVAQIKKIDLLARGDQPGRLDREVHDFEIGRLSVTQTDSDGEKTIPSTDPVSTAVDRNRPICVTASAEKVSTVARVITPIEQITSPVEKDAAQTKSSKNSSPIEDFKTLFKNRSPLRVKPILFKRNSPLQEIESPVEVASGSAGVYSVVKDVDTQQISITYKSPPMIEVHYEDNDNPVDRKKTEDSDSDVFEIQLEDTNGVEHGEEALETTISVVNGSNGLVEMQNERVGRHEVEIQTEDEEMERINDQEVENITYKCRSNDALDDHRAEAGVRYIPRPADLDRLDVLERRSQEMVEIVNRIVERLEPYAEQNDWERIINSVDFHVPNVPKVEVPWPETRNLPTFDKEVEEAGALGSKEVEENAAALHQAIKDRENEPAPDDDIILNELGNVVGSQGFRDYMSKAICDSVKTTLAECTTELFTKKYLPVFQKAHDAMRIQIVRSTNQSFIELSRRMVAERGPAGAGAGGVKRRLNKAFSRDTRACQHAVKAANCYAPSGMAENIATVTREVLEKEFTVWRKQVLTELEKLKDTVRSADGLRAPREIPINVKISGLPPQPTLAAHSVVSQLIKIAEINTMVNDDDINGAFEKALTAGDLALVMTACRAANPDLIFASPSRLKQHVMLSLIQQLATDMVHDTQLKCRYLEEALINVDTEDALIRKHLPTVAVEVRGHLSKFLQRHPSHLCGRKIKLIIMAADSMTKPLPAPEA